MNLSGRKTIFLLCILGSISACRLSVPTLGIQNSAAFPTQAEASSTPNPTRTVQVPATRAPTLTPTPIPTEPPWICASGSFTNHLNVVDKERHYNLHVPQGFKPGMPLVINFHGYNSTAEDEEEYTSTSILADEEGFIVAYPQAIHDPASWNIDPEEEEDVDMPFVEAVIDSIR